MENNIDHFTIGCASLSEGEAAMLEQLGVQPPRGSKHDTMSTHNCVMQAGDQCFFELLAIDPDRPAPSHPRWFSMDDERTRDRIAVRPRALGWVVRTSDLEQIIAQSPIDLGEVVTFHRGERSWRLTVPADGSLPENGLIPSFIEWSPGPHPSVGQADLGVRLDFVRLTHPQPERITALLAALSISHLAEVEPGPVGIAFVVDTQKGKVVID